MAVFNEKMSDKLRLAYVLTFPWFDPKYPSSNWLETLMDMLADHEQW